MSNIEKMAFHEQRLQDFKTRIKMLEKRQHNMAQDAIRREETIARKDVTIAKLTAELNNSRRHNEKMRKELGHYKRITNEPGEIKVMSRLDDCTRKWTPEVGSKAYNLGNWQTEEAKPYCEIVEALRVK